MKTPSLTKRFIKLSEQQEKVLILLSEGFNQVEIASSIGLSVNTVEVYVRAVKKKLGVKTTAHAVGMALRTNLIT